jgi:glycosyltransferase involved in cell wall biosynthesis
MDVKKICLVIPSLQSGGMERVMSELAHYFCAKSHFQVHLVLYGITREIFYPIPPNIIIHKPSFEFNNAKRILHSIKTFYFLRQTIRQIEPDTILSFGELWNNFVLLATLWFKYPIFVSDRCQPDKRWGKSQMLLRNLLYPKAAGIICQTEKASIIYQKMFKNINFQVIGNPIREIATNPNIPKENIVLSIGRLINTKHHDELIKVFSEINPQGWKLVIVGDDAIKQKNMIKLETLVKSLNIEEKVLLVGKKLNVEDYYNQAKIFAFTSSSEGFPNVLGEAMSAGLPVVAYDCVAGPSDLIDHEKTGFLVPLRDTVKFKFYLQTLMENEDLRNNQGKAAKEKIKLFSVEKIAYKFERVILDESTSN